MRTTVDLDLPLNLSPESGRSLSSQLASALREAVRSGMLRPGDRLPPSRVLAQRLSVSRGTVTAAFDQLDGEGYLRSTQGAGTFISSELGSVNLQPTPTNGTSTTAPARTLVLDLTPGQPDTSRLGDSAWRSAWRRASDTSMRLPSNPPLGLPELRSAVVEHLRLARGLPLEQASVMITAGTGEALAMVVQAVGNRNRRQLVAAVEEPGYPSARRVLEQLGVRVIPVPVDSDGLIVDDLPTGFASPDLVYTTPSHQYPLGGRLPVSRRLALLAWARAQGSMIIEDDYDSEFRHTGAPLPAMASLDSQLESVVHLGTFSKILTPSLRTGYLAASPKLMADLEAVRTALGNPVPAGTQLALAHYMDSGALRRHIARVRRDYRHRRELLIRTMADCQHIQLRALDGGLHAVLDLAADTNVSALIQAAADRGLLIADLADYYAVPAVAPGPGVVIGYGGASNLQLRDGLEIILDLTRQTNR